MLIQKIISYANFDESFPDSKILLSNVKCYSGACGLQHDIYKLYIYIYNIYIYILYNIYIIYIYIYIYPFATAVYQSAVKLFYFIWSWFYFLVVGLFVESCCDDNKDKIVND